MKVLVTGGAGFIGSHIVLRLAEAGHQPVTVDNLSNGHADSVLAGPLHVMDLRETASLAHLLRAEKIEAVMHLAGSIEAGISVADPLRFYGANVGASLSLLSAMREVGLERLVFSSTASVFGNPDTLPIHEDLPLAPVSPYGHGKRMIEQVLADMAAAHGFRSVSLRFFNAAGADPRGRLGERHNPETHLIPLAIAAALGRRGTLSLFGTDYPTPDGTCIRDYVHVSDIAEAHLAALAHLEGHAGASVYNIGTGQGHSVLEVIRAVEAATGLSVPVETAPRRAGDPAALISSNARACAELGWRPRFPAIEEMVAHAAAYMQRSPA